jgi:hypothetical protein
VIRPSPAEIARDGEFIANARTTWRRLRMAHDTRFALVERPNDPLCKPIVFETLDELVARIQRDRRGDSLQGFDAEVLIFGEDAPRQGVSLFAIDRGERSRFLGWAYLEGRKRDALNRALHADAPELPTVGRAA